MKEEVKTRIGAGNRSYPAVRKIFETRHLNDNLKSKVYGITVRPAFMYGFETCTKNIKEYEVSSRR